MVYTARMGISTNVKHGESRKGRETKEYRIWNGMLGRCLNPRNKDYKNYGGRGITVCERWRYAFQNFLADMGRCPDGKSLDRWPDNDGPYCKENCRWATIFEQANNRRLASRYRLFDFNGERKTLGKWAKQYGMTYKLLYQRIHNFGWTLDEALISPSGHLQITFNNQTKTPSEWASYFGVTRTVIYQRISLGKLVDGNWPS